MCRTAAPPAAAESNRSAVFNRDRSSVAIRLSIPRSLSATSLGGMAGSRSTSRTSSPSAAISVSRRCAATMWFGPSPAQACPCGAAAASGWPAPPPSDIASSDAADVARHDATSANVPARNIARALSRCSLPLVVRGRLAGRTSTIACGAISCASITARRIAVNSPFASRPRSAVRFNSWMITSCSADPSSMPTAMVLSAVSALWLIAAVASISWAYTLRPPTITISLMRPRTNSSPFMTAPRSPVRR